MMIDSLSILFGHIKDSRGNLQISHFVTVRDEIGYVFEQFEQFVQGFAGLVKKIQTTGNNSNSMNKSLLEELDESSQMLDHVESLTGEVEKDTVKMESSLQRITRSTEGSVDFFRIMEDHISDQKTVFNQLEKENRVISSGIQNELGNMSEAINETSSSSNITEKNLRTMINEINELTASSRKIEVFLTTTQQSIGNLGSGMEQLDTNISGLSVKAGDVKNNLHSVTDIFSEFSSSFDNTRKAVHTVTEKLDGVQKGMKKISDLGSETSSEVEFLHNAVKGFDV